MARLLRLLSVAAFFLGLASVVAMTAGKKSVAPPTREEQWSKVAEAERQGLPRTAIEELKPIVESAVKSGDHAEAIKAICKKITLEGSMEGNKPEEKIVRMKAAIVVAPAEMKPAMHAVLAHWYWQYFLDNRGRIVQRSAAGDTTGDDVTTWDLARILTEIDRQFDRALANEKLLKAIPVGQYDDLLVKGTISDEHRPTLWDFLAFEALHFYLAGEQAGAMAEDAFEIAAESPVFGTVEEFLKWQPKTTDTNSRTLKAVRLFQKLLAFHKDDKDPTAFFDADLHRLRLGFNHAVGTGKDKAYAAALERYVKAHADHDLGTLARYHWAAIVRDQEDLVQARKLALAGVEARPDSPGGKLCFNLVQEIEAKSSSLRTQRIWAEPLPDILLTYANIDKVYFRLVKVDYIERLKQTTGRDGFGAPTDAEYLVPAELKALLELKPVREFSRDLPPTLDFKPRTELIPAPKGLEPGYYFILASHEPNFSKTDNTVSAAAVWVSDLTIVKRLDYGRERIEGMVVSGRSGEPIPGASVVLWVLQPNDNWKPEQLAETDANGIYSFPAISDRSCVVVVSHRGQQLATASEVAFAGPDGFAREYEQAIFFTDRSLYRPGQEIRFKAIYIRIDKNGDQYRTLPNRDVTVVFWDTSRKEIARQKLRTNDYGSVSGSFTAPRDRLAGQMWILDEETQHGGVVSVEEYKRPKFIVTLDAPETSSRLHDRVALKGKATAYTGVPIGGAQVQYRVVRDVLYSDWYYQYFRWPMDAAPAQEIAHGTTTAAPDGTFAISFTARPDESVDEKNDPVFRYTITADVTDLTGETRSDSRTIAVGRAALRATVKANDWQTDDRPVKFALSTATLDGVGQEAKGTLKVYKLKQPDKVIRGSVIKDFGEWLPLDLFNEAAADPGRAMNWELGEVIHSGDFATDGKGRAEVAVKLPAGIYRAVIESKDRFGKAVYGKSQVQVLSPDAAKLNIRLANIVASPSWTVQPGQDFTLFWGTGYDEGRAYIEVEHRGKITKSFWTDAGKTQTVLKVPVTEAMRGGFTVRVTYVRENRAYLFDRRIEVPWSNKNLKVKWETFRSKLEPGKKETFTAVITGPDSKKKVAEMVAAVYDQSLDAYLPHDWIKSFADLDVFRQDYSDIHLYGGSSVQWFNEVYGNWNLEQKDVALYYRQFPGFVNRNRSRYDYFRFDPGGLSGWGWQNQAGFVGGGGFGGGIGGFGGGLGGFGGGIVGLGGNGGIPGGNPFFGGQNQGGIAGIGGGGIPAAGPRELGKVTIPKEPGTGRIGPKLDHIAARKNLNETAFFFPHLVANDDGVVRMEFTMPEALTKWKFLGFAHDKQLRSGSLTDEIVTAKDLMAQPNPPRFLRVGDVLEFPVKVSNQSPARQTGTVRLTFRDARNDQPIDASLGIEDADQAFDIPAGESKTFSWKITVPEGTPPLIYKAVAAGERLSDGEEGMLPVLAKKVLVTESLPLPIRGPGTKEFDFTRLRQSADSDTIRHQSYTVQMVSQPAWYAVMALPYLMEFPHECTEQSFNRLYANALARHIANSDPKIRKVFDLWKGTDALDSPLEKNQDLKSVLLDETPWVRQAVREGQARRNVGILFDDDRILQEIGRLTLRMTETQRPDGSWPWFPGGHSNDYITLYIMTGYGRLRHLGVTIDAAPAIKATMRLDAWMDETYRDIVKHGGREKNSLSSTIAFYLYGRSFFLKDRPVAREHREALDFWLAQAKQHWLKVPRQSQAHLAVALKRFGDAATPKAIMASIKEHSVSNEEMGMFWRDLERQYYWYRAPIETQAMMIEAFDEVMNDAKAVEDCKIWLLKQKQTQDWRTTKATADAIYALLLRGDNPLSSDALAKVTVGNHTIIPEKVEAGTGFYEERFLGTDVQPSMSRITLKKSDKGVSWGSAHWQYLEDLDKVSKADAGPLKIEKRLFKRTFTKAGPVIEPFQGEALSIGDEIVVRLVLRTDRDMEYVHLKDHRGSGTEPVKVLSQYRYQDGLAYYESTKDTATHFFIDYLPKGNYVFEYSVRVQHRGKYPTGFANIQCMYAPEFNSHSETIQLEVK